MHKRMKCKADGEDEYRSNLMVVRISSRRPTQQFAFQAPRQTVNMSFSFAETNSSIFLTHESVAFCTLSS